MKSSRFATMVLLPLCLASHAQAGPKDFFIYVTRLGGDTESARPYITKASAFFEKAMGWPKGSTSAVFLPDKKDALAFIEEKKPGFAILEPPLFFELRSAHTVEPIVQLESKHLVSNKLHLVVKDPSLSSLDKLKGKRLWTTLAGSPAYLTKVVFEGKLSVEDHFSLKRIGYALKGVRAVLRGQADATLLDDDMLEKAKKMRGGDSLRTVYTSSVLPPPPLVVFTKVLSKKEQRKLRQVLLSMCSSKEGAAICKEIMISRFAPLEVKLFGAAQRRYDKK